MVAALSTYASPWQRPEMSQCGGVHAYRLDCTELRDRIGGSANDDQECTGAEDHAKPCGQWVGNVFELRIASGEAIYGYVLGDPINGIDLMGMALIIINGKPPAMPGDS
jgi:hypothetical protein